MYGFDFCIADSRFSGLGSKLCSLKLYNLDIGLLTLFLACASRLKLLANLAAQITTPNHAVPLRLSFHRPQLVALDNLSIAGLISVYTPAQPHHLGPSQSALHVQRMRASRRFRSLLVPALPKLFEDTRPTR